MWPGPDKAVSTFAVPFACLAALLFVVGSAYAIYRCACTDANAEYRCLFRVLAPHPYLLALMRRSIYSESTMYV
jgi:hypothetical protein